jgi:hypothetical protein
VVKLTEAQRRVLLLIEPGDRAQDGYHNGSINWLTISALRRRQLTDGKRHGWQWREHLTPLGLAVRAHLLAPICNESLQVADAEHLQGDTM